jgi:hypothetical protein
MTIIAETNDEGTATIQWSALDGSGAMLIILADGSAAFSVKPVGGHYTSNAVDLELPSQLMEAIKHEAEQS